MVVVGVLILMLILLIVSVSWLNKVNKQKV